jgi:ubiquinone/menaquinone biosynthesis C-methylase UbiE
MSGSVDYVEQLQRDAAAAERYYLSSVRTKTEQQKALEGLLCSLDASPVQVADIACGAGAVSFHLSELLPNAHFFLADSNPQAVALARKLMDGRNARVVEQDLYALDVPDQTFDVTICWQTLSWIEDPARAARELVRITRAGGTILASALFNLDFDVDILAEVLDRTRGESGVPAAYRYKTYSRAAVAEWLDGVPCDLQIERFDMALDLARSGRGLGTYTERLADGRCLQISAGMLLNWGILKIVKR